MGEEVDILGGLAPFYPDGVSVGDIDKVKVLHDIFHNDFFVNQVNIGGVPLKVKPYKYNRSKKDNLPIEYEHFYEKFVHIIAVRRNFYHKVSCLFESSSGTLTGSSGLL